jgi:hypothetical protein
MQATLAAGNDVVDVLGGVTAVLAAMTVSGENGPSVEGNPGLVGHLHEVPEAYNGWLGEGHPLSSEQALGRVEQLGLFVDQ